MRRDTPLGRGRRRNVAAEPHRIAHKGYAQEGFPPYGRGYLLGQQGLDEGCRGAIRRRMHWRVRLGRGLAAHQPPLRLRLHTEPLVGGARLSDSRILGAIARGRVARARAFGAHTGAYGGCDGARGGGRETRRDSQGRLGGGACGRRAAYVLRQPVFPVRVRRVPRRASGGCASLVGGQVRRRYRQLGVAATYGRLLGIQSLCGRGQPSR